LEKIRDKLLNQTNKILNLKEKIKGLLKEDAKNVQKH